MRIRYDLFPRLHHKQYEKRFAMGKRKEVLHLPPNGAFRFQNMTIPRTQVETFSELRRLATDLTSDEAGMLKFLEDSWVDGQPDLELVIKLLNQVELVEASARLDHRPTFSREARVLGELMQTFLGVKDLKIGRAPNLATSTWINGVEMNDEGDFHRVVLNEQQETTQVNPTILFETLIEASQGSGFSLPRFHVPEMIEDQAWAGFWGFLATHGLLSVARSMHVWRTFDMVFIKRKGTTRSGGNSKSYRVAAQKFLNDGRNAGVNKAHDLLASLPSGAFQTPSLNLRDDFPLTRLSYLYFFETELREGKYVVEHDTPWDLAIRHFKPTRVYKQWRRQYLQSRCEGLGLDQTIVQSFVGFACDDENLRSVPLAIVDRVLRFIELEGMQGHWLCIRDALSDPIQKTNQALWAYALLPEEFLLKVQ